MGVLFKLIIRKKQRFYVYILTFAIHQETVAFKKYILVCGRALPVEIDQKKKIYLSYMDLA